MARSDLMKIKEHFDKIIHDLSLYNRTVRIIDTVTGAMPETLTKRVDMVLKAEAYLMDHNRSKELAAELRSFYADQDNKELAAELRSFYIAQDLMEGHVNSMDAKDIVSFIKKDKNNTFTPKIMAEMNDKTLESFDRACHRAPVYFSSSQGYEVSARRLLAEGDDKDIEYYQMLIRNGIRNMRDGKKTEPIAASKSVQHFRKAIEALQKRYQKYAEKLEPRLAELKETADKSAAALKQANSEWSDMYHLCDDITYMSTVIRSTWFTKPNDANQFLDTVNKHIKDFAQSEGKLEPLKLRPSKLPLIFGRKTAKTYQALQTKTVQIINDKLQSFTPFQLQKLAQYNTPILSAETLKQIKNDLSATRRVAINAVRQKENDERAYTQMFKESFGMAGFLAESLQTVDKYVTEAKNMQKSKAQKKTAELTGIAPNEKSGVTKVGQRTR